MQMQGNYSRNYFIADWGGRYNPNAVYDTKAEAIQAVIDSLEREIIIRMALKSEYVEMLAELTETESAVQ